MRGEKFLRVYVQQKVDSVKGKGHLKFHFAILGKKDYKSWMFEGKHAVRGGNYEKNLV